MNKQFLLGMAATEALIPSVAQSNEIPWCGLPKPGHSLILIHDDRRPADFYESRLVPPGAEVKRCRWWVRKPGWTNSHYSTAIGMFRNPANAKDAALRIRGFYYPNLKGDSRVVEVFRSEQLTR